MQGDTMKRIAKCPNDPEHTVFTTNVQIEQYCLVDQFGNLIDILDDERPRKGYATDSNSDGWTCNDCGEQDEKSKRVVFEQVTS